MPPKKRNAGSSTPSKTRRSVRNTAPAPDAIPDVYKDMLVEAYHANPTEFKNETRPLKRRKLSVDAHDGRTRQTSTTPSEASLGSVHQLQPVIYDEFEGSDESDAEFEDVDLGQDQGEPETDDRPQETDQHKSIRLDLSKTSTISARSSLQKRKPVGKLERQFRLDVHKWHVLCLLMHVAIRNKWCDNDEVHSTLKPLVPRKVISLLHMDESKLQSQRNFAFNAGLEELCEIWRLHWKINSRGMRKAIWRETIDMDKEIDEAEDPIDLEDFKDAARDCSGSRDLGAQLFCALLRSVAVEARLVCSLQVLPFSGIAKGETPQKQKPAYIRADAQDYGQSTSGKAPRQGKKRKRIIDSPYPIFWTEVYNPAITQWIPIDPVVRHSINKPRTGFEPPASDALNSMSYVIAFEDDGSAKDVTRRYVTWYNAKTRKARVESTKEGGNWWQQVMSHFRKRVTEPRDEIEEGSLIKRVATEGMPKNVQDFKDHPVYVLERHLRSNEVIEPKREVGKVATGSGRNGKLENVYRRQDVHLCRSADAWYRRGRDVSQGQQPLKRVIARRRRDRDRTPEDEVDGEAEGVALYAENQTETYVPPPVIGGRVPRNAYGNLDVYVPSMIPAGAVHVRHSLAAQAAKTMKISYSDAVTGFRFKGRQGTAVVEGIVIDQQYTAAIVAVIEGLEEQSTQDITEQRNVIISNIWKRMLAALRVRDRIQNEYGERDEVNDASIDDSNDDEDTDSTYRDAGAEGGFMPDASEATEATRKEESVNLTNMKDRLPTVLPDNVIKQPVTIVRSPHKLNSTPGAEDGDVDLFGSEDERNALDEGDGGFLREDFNHDNRFDGLFDPRHESEGGGFMIEEADDDNAGGFIQEREEGQHFIPEKSPQEANISSPKIDTAVAPIPNGPNLEETEIGRHNQDRNEDSAMDLTDLEPKDKQRQKASILATNSEQESDSLSQSSLLSHDPDEDDAEPQWLEEAFDSD